MFPHMFLDPVHIREIHIAKRTLVKVLIASGGTVEEHLLEDVGWSRFDLIVDLLIISRRGQIFHMDILLGFEKELSMVFFRFFEGKEVPCIMVHDA